MNKIISKGDIMSTQELIHAYVFSGDKKDKSRADCVFCNNYKNCQLYERKQCVLLGGLFLSDYCPYGRLSIEKGFTSRARSYHKWLKSKNEQYKDVKNKLTYRSRVLAIVGDYIFLPYSHMNMNKEIPFLSHSGFMEFGSYFMKMEHFTIDNIIKICEFKCRASFTGEEIKDYQSKVLPQFLTHLSEKIPDLYKKLCESYPVAKSIVSSHTHVGRKARLFTITPNVGEIKELNTFWKWDGEYLTAADVLVLSCPARKCLEVRVKPSEDSVVSISCEEQVNDNTEFID